MSNEQPFQSIDAHDLTLVRNVHPATWANPEPKSRYHLVVIGAGTAGLVSAAGAAGMGASVALVERRLMGGDCLNFGCVPSKALLRAARTVADVRGAGEFGVHVSGEVHVDFPALMERMRRLRADISPNDSAERFRERGVDVFFGDASFLGPDRVGVGDKTLPFRRAIIATGTRPALPAIPGLAEAGYLTNETVFALTELPARLAVIGAGPIGCELAQAFARFGARVTLIGKHQQILPREDSDAAALVTAQMRRDGVELLLSAEVLRVETHAEGKHLTVSQQAQTREVAADAILVAAGRMANVNGMCLDAAGVCFDAKAGVLVNPRLQTSNPRIFAAGDVCSQFKFTHAADAYARIAVQNALFYGRARADALVIPWCTYTDPEVAHVHHQGAATDPTTTFVQEFRHVDRAILDGDSAGFVKMAVRTGTDQIVAATIVSRHAGEMIGEVALAMTGGLGLKTLAKTIHPYPTHTEALKKIGDTYNQTRLTPTVRWLFEKWFRWT